MADLDLPVLDLRDLLGARRGAFVAALGDALERYGFVAITGHGIPVDLLSAAYRDAAAFFASPEADKRRFEHPQIGRQRGYTGYRVEHAKDHVVADLKEFYQLGRDLPADHPLVTSGAQPANVFPTRPESFTRTFRALFAAMDTFGLHLLGAIGEHLGLPEHTFDEAVHDGNSVLRVIHYPPVPPDADPHAVRAAAHEDINLLTILPTSTQPGLELLDKHGVWRALSTPPDVMICDTGDLMQRYTGGLLPSVTHRVVNPPGGANTSRYSMPYFMHPRPDWVIRPLRGEAAPITAGAFLRERLIENGVLEA
jgi:isopenicillin N synthase-like dioxygenase